MTGGRAWLPHPLLSLMLLAVWLLLSEHRGMGTLALGAVLALLIPILTRRFWPERVGFHHAVRMTRLSIRVVGDILVANLRVAGMILMPQRTIHPGFVVVPLALDNPSAITALAAIISLTPGTVSADLSLDHRQLLIHTLDARDPEALIAQIKRRYEQPLKEIFEC